jgi:hypothetical protein
MVACFGLEQAVAEAYALQVWFNIGGPVSSRQPASKLAALAAAALCQLQQGSAPELCCEIARSLLRRLSDWCEPRTLRIRMLLDACAALREGMLLSKQGLCLVAGRAWGAGQA